MDDKVQHTEEEMKLVKCPSYIRSIQPKTVPERMDILKIVGTKVVHVKHHLITKQTDYLFTYNFMLIYRHNCIHHQMKKTIHQNLKMTTKNLAMKRTQPMGQF